jgi:hypothetical protein
MADFADPSFHDGNGSGCANARGLRQSELARTKARIAKWRFNIRLSSNLGTMGSVPRRPAHRHMQQTAPPAEAGGADGHC